ncbi:MAG: proprotein convertase P-domain-containing protein, partial [Verrucomicrobiae bacterium]|nr:proprotein convertase P-domain-containing protein [Verrucomicrobiae bacterium]
MFLGDEVRTINVKLEVPTSSGDWKGYAATQRVNGREIGIGSVDMGINLFMLSEATSETRFRAVLNQDTSLLFPRDVFMNGVFYSGNQFSVTTNFEMPAGDRNAPPFDTFQKPANYDSLTPKDQARADYDADQDGVLDVGNPFPFPVRREITLLGDRVNPNRLEGSYIESITGLLPQQRPIFIEGTFFLNRQTLEPTKRSIFNQTTTNPAVLIGSTSGILYRETTLQVGNAVNITGITVSLNVDFPSPELLTVDLYGPNNQRVTLHRNGELIPAKVDLSDFNGLLATGTWRLRVGWNATGERGYLNSWSLNIQGLATYGVTGRIVGDLDQAPGTSEEPLAGAHITLTGSNLIEQVDTGPFVANATTTAGSTTVTLIGRDTASFFPGMAITGHPDIPPGTVVSKVVDAQTLSISGPATADGGASTTFGSAGVFSIPNLTENNYTLAITRPGFETRLISFFLNDSDLYLKHRDENGLPLGGASTDPNVLTDDPIILSPVSVDSPELRPGPGIGQAPLWVNFTALIPIDELNAIGNIQSARWNFGDGTVVVDTDSTGDDIGQTTAKHRFVDPGHYTVTLEIDGDGVDPALLTT